MKWMNLTIDILDFGIRLYGGSELSKHLSKCLPWMRKTQKIEADPNFFYDSQRFLRQCVNVIDITWSRIYFSTSKHFGRKFWTQCAMSFRVNNNDNNNNNLVCKDACKWTNFSFQCCCVTWQKNECLERLERWMNQFSFRLILHRFSLWGCHVMNEWLKPEDMSDKR